MLGTRWVLVFFKLGVLVCKTGVATEIKTALSCYIGWDAVYHGFITVLDFWRMFRIHQTTAL